MQVKISRVNDDYRLYVPRYNPADTDGRTRWVQVGVRNREDPISVYLMSLCGTFERVTGIVLANGQEKVFNVEFKPKVR